MLKKRQIAVAVALSAGMAVSSFSQSVEAGSVKRYREYELRVKSQSDGIPSVTLPDGLVKSQGRGDTDVDESHGKRLARNKAANAAKRCFDAAKNSTRLPSECQVKEPRGDLTPGTMKRYRINNLKRVAEQTICHKANEMNKGPNLRGYSIYAMVRGSGDVKRECGVPREGRGFYGIHNGGSLVCGGREFTGFTSWHNKSNAEIRTVASDFCQNRRQMNRAQVLHYEIKRNNGQIRAKFRCSN